MGGYSARPLPYTGAKAKGEKHIDQFSTIILQEWNEVNVLAYFGYFYDLAGDVGQRLHVGFDLNSYNKDTDGSVIMIHFSFKPIGTWSLGGLIPYNVGSVVNGLWIAQNKIYKFSDVVLYFDANTGNLLKPDQLTPKQIENSDNARALNYCTEEIRSITSGFNPRYKTKMDETYNIRAHHVESDEQMTNEEYDLWYHKSGYDEW